MAPGGTGTKKISGEGRVTFIKSTHAFLAKPGLDGGIFVVPSSIMGQRAGYPDMNELLSRNDVVKFEAEPQEERNGIKWVASDGTVKVIGKAAEIQIKGIGTVTKIDERYGQYGFLESDNGGIFFNANVVRPETVDITKVLKKGQRVVFEAIQQKNQPQCKFRATLIHLKNYKPPGKCAQSVTSSASVVQTSNNSTSASQSKQQQQLRPGVQALFSQISAPHPHNQQTQTLQGIYAQSLGPLTKGFQVLSTGSLPGSTDSSRPSTPSRAPTPPYVGIIGGPAPNATVLHNGVSPASSSPFLTPANSPYPPTCGNYGTSAFRPAPVIPNNQPLDIIIQQSTGNLAPKAPDSLHNSTAGNGFFSALAPSNAQPQPISRPKPAAVITNGASNHPHHQNNGWPSSLFGPPGLKKAEPVLNGMNLFNSNSFNLNGAIGSGGRKNLMGAIESLWSGTFVPTDDGWAEAYEKEAMRLQYLSHDHAGLRDLTDCKICTQNK